MLTLAVARRDAPGTSLSWEPILRGGWPGETPSIDAAKNRVYVAIAQLRSMGLRDVLLKHGAGYLLDPEIPLVWV
ncbi:MAG: hypothetical protein U0271_22115 [Polyangiaceae bacterium]